MTLHKSVFLGFVLQIIYFNFKNTDYLLFFKKNSVSNIKQWEFNNFISQEINIYSKQERTKSRMDLYFNI